MRETQSTQEPQTNISASSRPSPLQSEIPHLKSQHSTRPAFRPTHTADYRVSAHCLSASHVRRSVFRGLSHSRGFVAACGQFGLLQCRGFIFSAFLRAVLSRDFVHF